jgi:hypothetical protein
LDICQVNPRQLLTTKGFAWTEKAAAAFQTLKDPLVNTPVLALRNFALPFLIKTDACDTGMGAVLMQAGHPISYMSKALGIMNRKYL